MPTSLAGSGWKRTYSYDASGNLVSNALDSDSGTTSWRFSAYDAGIFGKAVANDGATVTQTVVEKNEEGAPVKVQRVREGSGDTHVYTISYNETGGIQTIATETNGKETGRIEFSDDGYLENLNGTAYDHIDQDNRLKEVALASEPVDKPVATYEYDPQERLVSMHLIPYALRYGFEYEDNAETPHRVVVSHEDGQTYETFDVSYQEVPASPWSEALVRTPHAVDFLNDPNHLLYTYSLSGIVGVNVAD